ncbi:MULTISPECIES: tryptophan--tRNA ligase [unclassified Gemella]|uniref:tryptophan--tRNA ligase n=1 Tax=unclassified Gemella TaxID=2624949 RepID=UPI0010748CCF|nr:MULTISPECIES: tryptophan--tRNA ligase [unclassified Gemella]MBF0709776.1 tryptophan--tRNA ligase [Gemella sp. GL1.1]MBF0747136.1 tryptophan--tRNA ligase [Gemella sp. 19428wG2_WT2a]NYS27120.1 tryptophan--tRNA ligase [Gemella sp. GL1]TFU58376.1 tryptophan--tRNA ligase [Gemella sp. WT2a]
MSKKIILTGDRPTGKLHLGHYVGSLENRLKLQEEEDTEMFIMIADQQALTDNADNPQKIIESVTEVALDYLAIGIDPNKTTIFLQSQIPQLPELMMYYMNLVSVSRLQRNPTVKQELKSKNFGESIPTGFFTYPISQAADITAFGATHVPVGEDQKPMIEQTREIVRDFNRIYNKEVLVEPEIVLPPKKQGRLVGIDGNGKMSKSLNNGIYLSDSPKEIQDKIMKMYTDPNHIRIEDPGQVEGNVVFTYLDIFDPNKEEVESLKEHYRRGGLGDVKLKRRLNDIMQDMLRPIRERREELAKDKEAIYKMLEEGSKKAEKVAAKTLAEVKEAMGINYFKK